MPLAQGDVEQQVVTPSELGDAAVQVVDGVSDAVSREVSAETERQTADVARLLENAIDTQTEQLRESIAASAEVSTDNLAAVADAAAAAVLARQAEGSGDGAQLVVLDDAQYDQMVALARSGVTLSFLSVLVCSILVGVSMFRILTVRWHA